MSAASDEVRAALEAIDREVKRAREALRLERGAEDAETAYVAALVGRVDAHARELERALSTARGAKGGRR